VFAWGTTAGAVYSTRRQADGCGVHLHAILPTAPAPVLCRMTPAQARALAHALHCAAAAAELTTQGGAL
jgi:hypothetical protein